MRIDSNNDEQKRVEDAALLVNLRAVPTTIATSRSFPHFIKVMAEDHELEQDLFRTTYHEIKIIHCDDRRRTDRRVRISSDHLAPRQRSNRVRRGAPEQSATGTLAIIGTSDVTGDIAHTRC
jgi:hypothetical protein